MFHAVVTSYKDKNKSLTDYAITHRPDKAQSVSEELHICLETQIKAALDPESTTDVTFLC